MTWPECWWHGSAYADAEQLAKWSLHIQEADRRTKPEAIFQNLLLLAQIARERHHDKEAESLFKRVLALQIQALGPEHYQIALTLDDLAAIAVNLGDYPEAETLYRRAIGIHEKINPLENLALAEISGALRDFLRRVNRAADAESQEFRARTIRNVHATRRAGAEAKAKSARRRRPQVDLEDKRSAAAQICPTARPPSPGGTRWCVRTRKPACSSNCSVRSASRRFRKQPPVRTTDS